MVADADGRYRLEAASLCFPSHWRLHDKLGHSLATIHAPVPHYAEELAAKVDTFFDRLRVDRPVQRRNLSIHSHDDLFRPEPHESPASFAPEPSGVDQVWLRSERQTLVRLPAHRRGAVHHQDPAVPRDRAAGPPRHRRRAGAQAPGRARRIGRPGGTIPFPLWLADWLGTPSHERSTVVTPRREAGTLVLASPFQFSEDRTCR